MGTDNIVGRLQVLEDIEALKKLKAQYCAYCDAGYDPDGIASLFVEDAVWDGAAFGKHNGRDAIRKFFAGAPKVIPFALHYVMNPLIEIDGDTATGQWYLFQPCTMSEGGDRAVWGAAKYKEQYVRVDGVWKFRSLKVNFEFWTPFDQGWVKNRVIQTA